jgi:hypothetical protein
MERYIGYTILSENTSNPDSTSHGKVAKKRYKSIDHGGHLETLGQGWMTGHQKRRPVAKKAKCSVRCQAGDFIPKSSSAGTCHTTNAVAAANQQNNG